MKFLSGEVLHVIDSYAPEKSWFSTNQVNFCSIPMFVARRIQAAGLITQKGREK
jgi:hypothetical protein